MDPTLAANMGVVVADVAMVQMVNDVHMAESAIKMVQEPGSL